MSIFFTNKEKSFINSINTELIDNVIKQSIILHKINADYTDDDNIYGESSEKIFYPGIQFNALINFLDPDILTTDAGVGQEREIEVYCHRESLKKKDIFPEEGDFLYWDDQYFEVVKVFELKHLEGLPTNKHTIRLEAKSADVSTITIKERRQ